jgi:CheY-like chemotaxis protein
MAIGSHLFTNRKVLLFDTDRERREGRADSLRERGVDVLCASDLSQARVMWTEDLYRLVLVDTSNSPGATLFTDEVKTSNPAQLLAFFVRKPAYLSLVAETAGQNDSLSFDTDAELNFRLEEVCHGLSHPNGLREASLRMLAMRYSKRRQHN